MPPRCRVGPAWPVKRSLQSYFGRRTQSTPGSTDWQKRSSLPCSYFENAACHERWRSGGDDRTNWTVAFLIPPHKQQADRLRLRDFWTRSGRGGRGRSGLMWSGLQVVHEPQRARDYASALTRLSACLATLRGTRDWFATLIAGHRR